MNVYLFRRHYSFNVGGGVAICYVYRVQPNPDRVIRDHASIWPQMAELQYRDIDRTPSAVKIAHKNTFYASDLLNARPCLTQNNFGHRIILIFGGIEHY